MNKYAVFLEDLYERLKTPMEQKSKKAFYICIYSTQEPGGINKHANFFRLEQDGKP